MQAFFYFVTFPIVRNFKIWRKGKREKVLKIRKIKNETTACLLYIIFFILFEEKK